MPSNKKHLYIFLFTLITAEQLAKVLRRGNATIAKQGAMRDIYQRLISVVHREKISISTKRLWGKDDEEAIAKANRFITTTETTCANETPNVFIIPITLERGKRVVKSYMFHESGSRIKKLVEFLATKIAHDPKIVM